MNKKILIFSLAYYPVVGGAEVAIKEISDRIPGVEFDMVTMRFDRAHKPEEKIGNVNVYRVGSGSKYLDKILFVPRAVTMAISLNNHRQYDKFWAVMTYMLFPISIMRIIFGNKTPYLLTLQDGDPASRVFGRLRILPFLPLLKYGFKRAEKVQTISNFLAGWAKKEGFPGEVNVIPNGVDINLFTKHFENEELLGAKRAMGIEEGNINLITTSRLSYKNGIDTVIKAMQFLPNNFIFTVIGQGEEANSLKNLAHKLGVADRVKFLGFIDYQRLPVYLKASDIFIRPSRSEGMGNSFIEAMAAGIPVIGTNVGGIPDFLKDNETGFFCDVSNPEKVAGVIQKVANLPQEQKNKITLNAQNLAKEKYDWSLISQNMAKILG